MSEAEEMQSVMPEPWFNAVQYNKVMDGWLTAEPLRPLKAGERRLLGFILPPFQRPAVWSIAQKVRLIESIWAGIPVGAYVVNRILKPPYALDGWLLDGQQRWTAIAEYVAGEFAVHCWRYPDLPETDRHWFRLRPMAELETKIASEEQAREVYERLAYGGTAHQGVQQPT